MQAMSLSDAAESPASPRELSRYPTDSGVRPPAGTDTPAMSHTAAIDVSGLDSDGDGVPCESVGGEDRRG